MPEPSHTLVLAGAATACVGLMRARATVLESIHAYKNRRKGFCEDLTVAGKPGAVELYHNTDSYCSQAARAALCEAEVEWDSHHLELHPRGDKLDVQLDEGYKLQHLSPEYKAINPWCTVPVLVHDGHPVYESKYVVKYVAAKLAKKEILAKEPVHVERMRFWLEQAYLDNFNGKTAGGCIPMLTSKALIQQSKSVKFATILHYSWNHPCRDRALAMPVLWVVSNLGLQSAPSLVEGCRKVFCELLDRMEKEFAEDIRNGLDPENVYLAGCGYITIADIIWMPALPRMEQAGLGDLFSAEARPLVHDYVRRIKKSRGFALGIRGTCSLTTDSGLQSLGDPWKSPEWVEARMKNFQHSTL